jgi:hypothetical protein
MDCATSASTRRVVELIPSFTGTSAASQRATRETATARRPTSSCSNERDRRRLTTVHEPGGQRSTRRTAVDGVGRTARINLEPISGPRCCGNVLTGLRIAYAHDGDAVATEIVDLSN